jgi:hypothetical protein
MLALSASVKCSASKCKGVGPHWDVLLLSLCNVGVGGFMGGPWVSAATTRAVLHINTLQVDGCFIGESHCAKKSLLPMAAGLTSESVVCLQTSA